MIQSLKSEPAVSPVIGTILLVAMTVVLVGIVSAVMMGLVGDTTSKDVGLTVEPVIESMVYGNGYDTVSSSASAVRVMVYGGRDVNDLINLTVEVEGAEQVLHSTITTQPTLDNIIGIPIYYQPFPQGPAYQSATREYPNVRVTVIGEFTDGTMQVLADTRTSIPSPTGHSLWTATMNTGEPMTEERWLETHDNLDNYPTTLYGLYPNLHGFPAYEYVLRDSLTSPPRS